MTTSTMRSEPTPERRREVEELVSELPAGDSGELAFDEPWQLRVFALAVAAHETGHYEWAQFQRALIASIKEWEGGDVSSSWSYHEHWVNALEEVLGSAGVVDPAELDARAQDVLATPANRNHHEPHYEPVAVDPARRRPRG